MNEEQLKRIIESVLFASGQPVDMAKLMAVFPEEEHPGKEMIEQCLQSLQEDYQGKSIELKKVSSGYRFQVRQDYADWVGRLHEERPTRYSRATLETMALIAYRQPITRAEIEEVRGVSVSSQIIKTLMEREWIRVVGHRDVPGKPALYATTKIFLDYFNLQSLEELPPLAELRDIDSINAELDLQVPGMKTESAEDIADDDSQHDEMTASESDGEPGADPETGSAEQDTEADTVEEAQAEEQQQAADADSHTDEDAANQQSMMPESAASEVIH